MFIPQIILILRIWRKPSYIHHDLTEIAKKSNPDIKNVIIKAYNKMFAYRNLFTNNIVMSQIIIEILSCEEIKGVLYHETLHRGKSYGLIKKIIVGALIIPLMFLLSILLWVFSSVLLAILAVVLGIRYSIVITIIFSITILLFERVMWKSEYEADLLAAREVGFEIYESMMRKMVPEEKTNWNWHSHPSVEQRILYLKKNLK